MEEDKCPVAQGDELSAAQEYRLTEAQRVELPTAQEDETPPALEQEPPWVATEVSLMDTSLTSTPTLSPEDMEIKGAFSTVFLGC